MKKYAVIILVLIGLKGFSQGFPGTDSMRTYNSKYITNNPATAFTNLRLHTLLRGIIDWIDTARAGTGGGGAVGVDSIAALNDSTIRYRKNGSFKTFVLPGRHWTLQGILNNGATLTSNPTITLADSLFFASGKVLMENLRLTNLTTVTDTTLYKPRVQDANGNTFVFDRWPGGTINNASNVGTGVGLFKDKTSDVLNYKSIINSYGLDWFSNTNDIQAKIDSAKWTTITRYDTLRNRVSLLENTQWYVDALSGNDANDGKSDSRAVKTISKLITLPIQKNDVINIARGSYFRESLSITSLDSLTIRDYGIGNKPVFDCADTAYNYLFIQDGTYSNIQKIAWTNQFIDVSENSVWEDGYRLIRASSLSSANSTPGSYYTGTPTAGGTDTIYVHSRNSTSIITNGLLYEISRRRAGIRVGLFCKVYNMHTRRNGGNNGSIEAAENCYLSGIIAEDGVKHNFFMGSGVAENCVAWKCDSAYSGGTTLFVSFTTSAGADTMDVLYKNCIAIASKNGDPNLLGTVAGLYAHVGGPTTYRSVTWDGGHVMQCGQGIDGEPGTINVRNANFFKCATAISKSSSGGSLNIYNSTFVNCSYAANFSSVNSVSFEYNKVNTNGIDKIIKGAFGTLNCNWNTAAGANINGFVEPNNVPSSFIFKHNIFTNPSGNSVVLLAGGTTGAQVSAYLTADSNYYNAGAYVFDFGAHTLATMQGTYGKDINSSDGTTQSIFNGNFNTTDIFIEKTDTRYGKAGSFSTFDSLYRFPYQYLIPDDINIFSSTSLIKSTIPQVETFRELNTQDLYVYKNLVLEGIDSVGTATHALYINTNTKKLTIGSTPLVAAGTYTPTITNGTNVTASTAYQCQYMRVGNVVTVSGKIDIDPSATGSTDLGLTLPISSGVPNDFECAGTAVSGVAADMQGAIRADTVNDRAQFIITIGVGGSTANNSWFFIFTYLIDNS